MPRTQDIPLITKPEEDKSFQIYEEISAIKELIETSGIKIKKEDGEINVVLDSEKVGKKLAEPFQKGNKEQQLFFNSLTNKFKEILETPQKNNEEQQLFFNSLTNGLKKIMELLSNSIKKVGKEMTKVSSMLLIPIQLITKSIEELMSGKIFDKLPELLKPPLEENKPSKIQNDVSIIRKLIETGEVKLKETIKTKPIKDDKKVEKEIIKPLQKSNKDQQGFLSNLTAKFKETTESLLGTIKKIGTGIAEGAFNMMLGPLQLITKPIEEMMGGKIFDKLMGILKPKPFKGKATKQKVLPKDPGAVLIAETLEKEEKEKKKAIKGKWLAIAALAGGIIWAAVEAIMGWIKAEDWEVSKLAGAIGAFLGGTGKGPINAIKNAFKLGTIGAGIGFMVGGGIPGAIIGGILGFVVGGILGWIGGEKIAEFVDSSFGWAMDYIKGTAIGATIGGMAGLVIGGPIGMLIGIVLGAVLGTATEVITGWMTKRIKSRVLKKYGKEITEKDIEDYIAFETLELESKLVKAGYTLDEATKMAKEEIEKKILTDSKFEEEMMLYLAEVKKAGKDVGKQKKLNETLSTVKETIDKVKDAAINLSTLGGGKEGLEKFEADIFKGVIKPEVSEEISPTPKDTKKLFESTIKSIKGFFKGKEEERINKRDEEAINKEISMNTKEGTELEKIIQKENYDNRKTQDLILAQLKMLTNVEKEKEGKGKNVVVTTINNDIHKGEDIDRVLLQGNLAFS